MNIANNIKQIAQQKGITITELADKLNMPQPTLSTMIHGNPTLSSLANIANALDCNIIDLFIPINQTNTNNIMLSCPHCHKIINIEIKQPK